MEPVQPQLAGATIIATEDPRSQTARVTRGERDEREERNHEEAADRKSPTSAVIHEAIRREGEEELARSSSALFWSGIAAGLAMGFSMFAQAWLQAHLPDAEWTPLVSKLGYGAGFVIVILGRQQLFTENTLKPIIPLLERSRHATLGNVLRLWTIVLVANLVGAVAIALVSAHTTAFDADTRAAFAELGAASMSHDFATALLRGIFAGWLIALIVWLLPAAESARLWVIILIAYLIGIGEFTHVVAGSVESFTYAAMGHTSWMDALTGYTVPALIGNIIGGVALAAALNHAQVVAGGESARGRREHGRVEPR